MTTSTRTKPEVKKSLFTFRPPEKGLMKPTIKDGGILSLGPGVEDAPAVPLFAEDIPSKRKFSPLIMGFIGRRGKGKSLGMTAVAKLTMDRAALKGNRFSVASNYQLDFADWKDPFIVDIISETYPWWARDMLICIDEIQAAFPNRRSIARINLDFATFLTQIRKRRVEVMWTTQFPQVLDYMVLMQTDLFIECEQFNNARAIDCYVHDYWGQFTGKNFKKPWPPRRELYDWQVTLWNTDAVWGLYDTEEVVPPLWSKARDDILVAQGWTPDEGAPEADEDGVVIDTAGGRPETLEDMALRIGGKFNIMALMSFAWMESDIKAAPNPKKALGEWLGARGFKVWQQHGVWYAERG